MNCPYCSSPDIRVSRHTHNGDLFQRIRGRQAYRCRKCRHRFYAAKSSLPATERLHASGLGGRAGIRLGSRTRKLLVRRIIIVAIFAAMFAIFCAFLSYLTSDRKTSDLSGVTSLFTA